MATPGDLPPAARQFSERWFGFRVTTQETRPTVGTSAAALVPANPNRVAFLLANRSGSDIDLGFDNSVAVGNGIPVAGNGGTLEMDVTTDGESVSYALFAVGPAAGLSCYLIEVISY